MHCPNCRQDNAATTRFCTECGAVLVEEAPGGGRRRVLRPWGLRRSAPPTVAPDFPDALAPSVMGARTRGRGDFWLAGAVVAVVAFVAVVNPWDPLPEAPGVRAAAASDSVPVAIPAPTLVRETRLAAPALVEPLPPAPASAVVVEPPAPSLRYGPSRGVGAIPVAVPMPSRDIVVGDGESAEPPPVVAAAVQPAAAPKPDRWQQLAQELSRCAPQGLLERAMCEQGARLAHCEGHWGLVPQCPPGRTEYGQ